MKRSCQTRPSPAVFVAARAHLVDARVADPLRTAAVCRSRRPRSRSKSSLPVEGEYLPVELTCSVRGSAGKVVLTHMNYRGFTRRLRIDFERTLVRHVRLEQGHINEGEYVKLKEVTVTDQLNSEDRDFVTKMTTAVKNEVGNACGANQAKRAAYREDAQEKHHRVEGRKPRAAEPVEVGRGLASVSEPRAARSRRHSRHSSRTRSGRSGPVLVERRDDVLSQNFGHLRRQAEFGTKRHEILGQRTGSFSFGCRHND